MKKVGIPAIVTLIVGAMYYYVALPPLNYKSSALWFTLVLLCVVFIVTRLLVTGKIIAEKFVNGERPTIRFPKKIFSGQAKVFFRVVLGIVIVAALAIAFTSVKLFNAPKYQKMLPVKESDFKTDIAEIPMSKIPVVDRDTATRLGSRKIGEVVELVSQFNVSESYTQINYKQSPVRVSPLEYAGFLKWIGNRSKGVPYYVKIDMATQNTELVKLTHGMKYLPSEYFSRDLMRYIRFKYPTKMFEETNFEIDDDGNPYWIISYYDYTIGLFGGKDIKGVVAVNAETGETQDYKVKDVPKWIDRVYDSNIILNQAKNWGAFGGGYFNSIFGQKNVVRTTGSSNEGTSEGYNYIAFDNSVWLYTGITSVVQDQSNVGFILVNTRTKETRRYAINGAEEYSAMESAQGMIQEKRYVATFPILVNIADTPSYFISLKDDAGLVKAYSFVSIEKYQIVGVADTLEGARKDYVRLLKEQGVIDKEAGDVTKDKTVEVSLVIENINSAVVSGNSVYYIKAVGSDKIYTANISISNKLPLFKIGDTLKGKVLESASTTLTEIQ